ncbi:MAG: hypothetical protein AB1797_04560 [bacterium]
MKKLGHYRIFILNNSGGMLVFRVNTLNEGLAVKMIVKKIGIQAVSN